MFSNQQLPSHHRTKSVPPILLRQLQQLPKIVCPRSLNNLEGYFTSPTKDVIGMSLMPARYIYGSNRTEAARVHKDLEIMFDHCKLLNESELNTCMHPRSVDGLVNKRELMSVAVFGDSQARHLGSALSDLFHAKHQFLDNNMTSTVCDKSFLPSPMVQVFIDNWGYLLLDPKTVLAPELLSCSIFLMNFGQWQAAWRDGYAWPVSRYSKAVRIYLLSMRSRFATKRLIWLTVNPFPDTPSMYMIPPKEWRSQEVLRAYNDAAIKVANELKFEYIDTFKHANGLHDLSYDGAHFKAPLLREVLCFLLLCNTGICWLRC